MTSCAVRYSHYSMLSLIVKIAYKLKSQPSDCYPVKYYWIFKDEASNYHFDRMIRQNRIDNAKTVRFEYDALLWSLYSVGEHLFQEINLFFNLGIKEKDCKYQSVKKN
jgi:hypothetical protein